MPKSKSEAPAATVHVEPADAVQQARTRARHRLIGAVVLLLIGIIGFPLVFETAPRPIPIDTPIEIPARDAMPPLLVPAARPSADVAPASSAAAMLRRPSPAADVLTETAADAGRDVTPAPAASVAAVHPPVVTASAARPGVAASAAKPAVVQTAAPASAAASSADEGARVLALLEGRSAASAASRFVVQAGAYADADGARDVRKQLERLGLKTYLQVIDSAGRRVYRVRLGPFAARADADAALAKARAAGIDAAVITL